MNGERLADDVSRRLARASGRRAVLAGLVASLAAGVAGASGGGVRTDAVDAAAAAGRHEQRPRRHRSCRRDNQCRWAEVCTQKTCRGVIGFAGRSERCRRRADCDARGGPVVCEPMRRDIGCFGCIPEIVCTPPIVCLGTYDSASGISGSCTWDCDCVEGLACRDGGCEPTHAT